MAVISITVNIILLAVFSLFSEALVALDRYVWPISIFLWCTLIFGFYMMSRAEEDPKDRAEIMSIPFAGIPCYTLLLTAIPGIFKGDPISVFLGVMLMLPLVLSAAVAIGIGCTLLAGKLPTKLIVPASLIFNILATFWLVSIGV